MLNILSIIRHTVTLVGLDIRIQILGTISLFLGLHPTPNT